MPSACALAFSFCTIRFSFAPESTYFPSSRTLLQTSFYLSSSDSFNAFMAGSLAQPFSMMSSEKASRVPEVEGGPNTEMTELGREGSTSDHFSAFCSLPKGLRSEEHTSELQSLMRISYAVFCLKK